MQAVKIGGFFVGSRYRPFIAAEMSGNHNHSLERALAIVDAAAAAGVQAVKLQTYTADTMTLNCRDGAFMVEDPQSLWSGRSLYDLYSQAYTPWGWHKPIFDRCREHGIVGFSSPFDETAVDFLEELAVPCYKIASFEVTDLPLIRRVALTGKPLILSTGMATLAEIDEAVRTARSAGNDQLVLLKCTSTYPSSPVNSDLLTIPHLRASFDCVTGLSDHSLGIGVAVAAVPLGASFIEKHFTLARADGGVDSAFSLEPAELKQLAEEAERAHQALGRIHYGPSAAEAQSLMHRRSLYIAQDIKAGEALTPENLRIIRPGLGLPPKYWDVVLGKPVVCDLKQGTPLRWKHV
ncbi:pseudaminic acid synthase|uniref:N-acetylneuraminate synthase n=1 Tax=Dendrosporobacter quercicolus TaxID=146817 RepID=A0A1G9WXQ3_9FIRM|nr:pseudaminic acid synthase [Dendrosporobacter quercicolus]NSL49235.1 pseudaminic acid synthase [Dendrosporobacter quercicolus DSM 1736]SDM88873.1 N-acetylneuraminate synthase [Dendrosporobacter quercicolus]